MWLWLLLAVEFYPHWIFRIAVRKFNSEGLSDLGVYFYSTVEHSTEIFLLSHECPDSGTVYHYQIVSGP